MPSEQEQKRIVAILDEAFAGISQAIANTEKNQRCAGVVWAISQNQIFNWFEDEKALAWWAFWSKKWWNTIKSKTYLLEW